MRFLGSTLLTLNPLTILRTLGPVAWPFVSNVRKDVERRFGGIAMLKYLYHSELCTSTRFDMYMYVGEGCPGECRFADACPNYERDKRRQESTLALVGLCPF
jgi:hypothetical protein